MIQYIDALGRIIVNDEAALGSPTIFDTADGSLFADPADYFTGSITLPSRSASSEGVDGTQNIIDLTAEYFVGTPSAPSSNIVLGQFRRSTDTFWRSAWGTHVLNLDGVGITTVPQTDTTSLTYLASLRAVTPIINPLGHVAFRERTIIRPRDPGSPPAITKTFAALTLEYRLFAGAWWGNPYQTPRADAALSFGRFLFLTSANMSLALNAGYAYPGRRLVVVIQNPLRATNPTSVTIGGVAATIHDTIATADTRTTIASAIVPTGVTPTVAVNNITEANTWVAVSIFAVRSITGAAPTIYKTSTASGTGTTLSIPSTPGATAIVVSTKNGSATATCTWINATEVLDQGSVFPGAISSALLETVPGGNVTANWTTAESDITMMAAVFT